MKSRRRSTRGRRNRRRSSRGIAFKARDNLLSLSTPPASVSPSLSLPASLFLCLLHFLSLAISIIHTHTNRHTHTHTFTQSSILWYMIHFLKSFFYYCFFFYCCFLLLATATTTTITTIWAFLRHFSITNCCCLCHLLFLLPLPTSKSLQYKAHSYYNKKRIKPENFNL